MEPVPPHLRCSVCDAPADRVPLRYHISAYLVFVIEDLTCIECLVWAWGVLGYFAEALDKRDMLRAQLRSK